MNLASLWGGAFGGRAKRGRQQGARAPDSARGCPPEPSLVRATTRGVEQGPVHGATAHTAVRGPRGPAPSHNASADATSWRQRRAGGCQPRRRWQPRAEEPTERQPLRGPPAPWRNGVARAEADARAMYPCEFLPLEPQGETARSACAVSWNTNRARSAPRAPRTTTRHKSKGFVRQSLHSSHESRARWRGAGERPKGGTRRRKDTPQAGSEHSSARGPPQGRYG
mmetsp:Transcript_10016/g.31570  ORF Transcript_10016/g.31570 Transcript_10016/m.31570 type:complete len:225 (-) Transcript_10016:213-887(-)